MTDQTLKDIDRAFKALEEQDELLDKIRAKIYLESVFPVLNTKMQEAIKALCTEQEPLEVEVAELQKAYNKGFEDCRQAVLDIISELNAISFYEAQEDSRECYREIKQMIKQLTPVNPQPKTGHWISYYCAVTNERWYACSHCRSEVKSKTDYCPSCGYKMESEGI